MFENLREIIIKWYSESIFGTFKTCNENFFKRYHCKNSFKSVTCQKFPGCGHVFRYNGYDTEICGTYVGGDCECCCIPIAYVLNLAYVIIGCLILLTFADFIPIIIGIFTAIVLSVLYIPVICRHFYDCQKWIFEYKIKIDNIIDACNDSMSECFKCVKCCVCSTEIPNNLCTGFCNPCWIIFKSFVVFLRFIIYCPCFAYLGCRLIMTAIVMWCSSLFPEEKEPPKDEETGSTQSKPPDYSDVVPEVVEQPPPAYIPEN